MASMFQHLIVHLPQTIKNIFFFVFLSLLFPLLLVICEEKKKKIKDTHETYRNSYNDITDTIEKILTR